MVHSFIGVALLKGHSQAGFVMPNVKMTFGGGGGGGVGQFGYEFCQFAAHECLKQPSVSRNSKIYKHNSWV